MKQLLFIILLLSSLTAADDSVNIKAEVVEKDVVVYAQNRNHFSITVKYDASYTNLSADKKLPLLFVMKPFAKEEILHLKILNDKFSFKAHYDWTIGSKDAKHDDNYIYKLPYKTGTAQKVSQSFNGKFTHFNNSQYAVDFEMNEGTEVYSARDGVVVKTKADSNSGGTNRSFEKHANEIIIEHNDGTLASYTHLKQNGVLVKVGEKVNRAQLIGYSGKTGYTRGPHLHFVVYKATDGKNRKSFPIKFMSARGIVNNPTIGQVYKSH